MSTTTTGSRGGQAEIAAMRSVATTLVIIYAVVGGVMVVLSALLDHIDPALRLSFSAYLQQMAIAAAALSIGRGLTANAKARAS